MIYNYRHTKHVICNGLPSDKTTNKCLHENILSRIDGPGFEYFSVYIHCLPGLRHKCRWSVWSLWQILTRWESCLQQIHFVSDSVQLSEIVAMLVLSRITIMQRSIFICKIKKDYSISPDLINQSSNVAIGMTLLKNQNVRWLSASTFQRHQTLCVIVCEFESLPV